MDTLLCLSGLTAFAAVGWVAAMGYRRRASARALELEAARADLRSLRERLEDRDRRLAQAQRLAGLGTWEWTLSSDRREWAHEALRLLSMVPEGTGDTAEGSLLRVHPDDRDNLRGALTTALARKKPLDLEFRTVRLDGTVRYLNARAEVVRSRESGTHRLIGTVLDITDFKHAEEALRRLASVDSLTGAYSRRYFFQLGRQELEKWRRYHLPLTAMMVDLDGFKQLNDTFGHPEGDRLLREVARTARKTLRRTDILGRYGGDEFAVLLPNSGLDAALESAERLRQQVDALRLPLSGSDARAHITLSIGVAEARPGDEDVSHVLKRADEALYEAKSSGRNRVVSAAPPAPNRASS